MVITVFLKECVINLDKVKSNNIMGIWGGGFLGKSTFTSHRQLIQVSNLKHGLKTLPPKQQQ